MSTAYSTYAVYTYTSGVQGMAGRIIDDGGMPPSSAITVAPDMHTGLNGDPKVEGFIDGNGKLCIAVTDYDKGSQRPVYIHDATNGSQISGSLSWPEDNLYTLVRLGNFLYAIDYDNGKVIEIDATTYLSTGKSYTLDPSLNPDPSTYQACGQELIVVNGTLYGLFAFPDTNWATYAPSLIVSFNITSSGIAVDKYNRNLAKNAFAVATDGSSLYVASIGGPQQSGTYNPDSRLQSLPLDLASVTDRMSPSANRPYEFRDITFNGTRAYVLVGTYNSNWNMDGLLFSTTNFTATPTIDTISDEAGYFWSTQYTADNNRLWYAHGNSIRVYDAGNGPVPPPAQTPAELGMANLSGSGSYDSLNDLGYVGAVDDTHKKRSLRGYRSPLQRSRSPLAVALRAITGGRPEATPEEFAQARAAIGK